MSRSRHPGCGGKCMICRPHKCSDKGKGKCRKNVKASVRRKLHNEDSDF